MSTEERGQAFNTAIREKLPEGAFVTYPMLGYSNGARVYEDHLFLGGPNLNTFMGGGNLESFASTDFPAFAITSCISPLLGVEVHIGVGTLGGVTALRNILKAIADARVAANQSPGHNNSLVGLSRDGELLVKIGKETEWQNTHVKPERFFVSVYPGDARTRLNPAVQEFVALAKQLMGEAAVRPLDLWAEESITDAMRRLPAAIPIAEIEAKISTLGGRYSPQIVRRFHDGLNFHPRRHFVIVSGVSGTGKTSLAQRYAYAVHGLNSLADNDPLFFWCRVRPDWTDPTGLLGHYDVFSQKFAVPPFLDAILTANAYPSSPIFVCLDEMNLARVEYYLADALSAMETPDSRLQLHTNASAYDGDSGVKVPKTIPWPTNLFIVGTINIDETTSVPSPKVLDRAVVIDVSDIDVPAIVDGLKGETALLNWAGERCGPTLVSMYDGLKKHQQAFGYRTVEDVLRYVAFASEAQTDDVATRLLDQQINQKVLTKLRGTYEQAPMLDELKQILSVFELCTATMKRLESELAEIGSFQGMR